MEDGSEPGWLRRSDGPYRAESGNIASYLYQQIESPVDQEATILIGNDDGAKIWLNGEKVFENRDHFAAVPERNKLP